MNKLWDVCGVNCEISEGGDVSVGDPVAVIPNTHQPKRANPGTKPPGFFVEPPDRTVEQAKSMVIPPFVAAIMCLIDPVGFERVEDGYSSTRDSTSGASEKAYGAGMYTKSLRAPLLVGAGAAVLAVVVSVTRG
jgi:hypothetical protein